MYRLLMTVLAAVGVAWGLTALLVPDLLAQLYGGTLDPFARAFSGVGAAIAVGFGLVDWSSRNLAGPGIRRGILASNLVAVALIAVILLVSTVAGTFNSLGWLGGLAHAALAAVVFLALVRER